MDRSKFNELIETLSGNFGAKHFPPERITFLWRCFERVKNSHMEQIVNKFMRERKVTAAPVPEDFIAERQRLEKREQISGPNGSDLRIEITLSCESCGKRFTYIGPSSFVLDCDNNRRLCNSCNN